MKIIPVSQSLVKAHQDLIEAVKKPRPTEENFEVKDPDSLGKYFKWFDALIQGTGLGVTTHAMHQYNHRFFVMINDPRVIRPYYGDGRCAEFYVEAREKVEEGHDPYKPWSPKHPYTKIQSGFRCGKGNEPPSDNFHQTFDKKRFLRAAEIDNYLRAFLARTNATLSEWFNKFDQQEVREIKVLEAGETREPVAAVA